MHRLQESRRPHATFQLPPKRLPPTSQKQLLISPQHIRQNHQRLPRNPSPLPHTRGEVNQRPPKCHLARLPKELQKPPFVILNHSLEHGKMRRRDPFRRRIGHSGQSPPKLAGGKGILHLGAIIIPQRESRKAGAQSRHALEMPLLGHKGARAILALPTQPTFALGGALVAVDAEEDRTDDVEFGHEDVDEREAVPAEVGRREDPGGDDAERVRGSGVDGCFVAELGDERFGEDVEEVEEEGGAVAVGDRGRWLEEKFGDVDLGVGHF